LLNPLIKNKWVILEKRLRAIEGFDFYDPIRAAKICLVSNAVMPKKSRVLEFVKYTG
jgi:hypothetical protein